MQARRWWNDDDYRQELSQRAATGNWFIRQNETGIVGRVTAIIYCGYKVQIPSGSLVNVDLTTYTVSEISADEYNEKIVEWVAREESIRLHELSMSAHVEEPRAAQIYEHAAASSCLHLSVISSTIIRVAGCDIEDTVCSDCHRILRRSWSTAYDRDPPDHISDWNWYLRKCASNNFIPHESDYNIVEYISSL